MPHQPFAQNVAIQAGCGKAFLANRPIFRNLIPASVPYELLNPKLQASRTWLWGFAPSGCAACPPFTSRSKPLEARGADAYGSQDYLPRKTCCPIKLCMRKSSYPLPQQILSSAALNICIISTPADGYNQGCRSCCCMVRHLTRGPPHCSDHRGLALLAQMRSDAARVTPLRPRLIEFDRRDFTPGMSQFLLVASRYFFHAAMLMISALRWMRLSKPARTRPGPIS